MKETIGVFERYNAAGELVEHETRKMEKAVTDLGRTGDLTARSFLHNTFVVGAWAASVGTFYAALSTLRSGAEAHWRHDAEVRAYFRDRQADLLIMDIREGRSPLCRFLGRMPPAQPFPWQNRTFEKR